ncbi:hypothetical protein ATANTOWER_032538 [Ataeniobius toweri]|uniref:Uncharacterized protein n=1 Tax=Ataeniobius toweri TaxID=208326 RepID=A0ABU7BC05_9TELE|nr:hypothetical protein [Ataeniobius toweri]
MQQLNENNLTDTQAVHSRKIWSESVDSHFLFLVFCMLSVCIYKFLCSLLKLEFVYLGKKDGPVSDWAIILAVGQSDSHSPGGKFHDETKLQLIRGCQRN